MTNTHRKSAASFNRGPLAGRIAGAAVAGALLLGAPLLGTLVAAPGIAVADKFDDNLGIPDFDGLTEFCKTASSDCDGDGVSYDYELKRGTDPYDRNSVFAKGDFDGFGSGFGF